MRKIFLIIYFALMPGLAFGQNEQTMNDTLKEISKDLAGLHQKVQETNDTRTRESFSGLSEDFEKIRITKDRTAIRAGADNSASVISNAFRGDSFEVIDKVDDWYAIRLEKPSKEGLVSGWVNASNLTPETIHFRDDWVSFEQKTADIIYEQITSLLAAIRKKYENNPYVRVTGFTVDVGMSPSVSISFEFK